MKKLTPIKDFLVTKDLPLNINFKGYDKIFFDSITIYYKNASQFSFLDIIHFGNQIEINLNNSFFPVFLYQNNNQIIITPNYEHFINLKLHLSINETGIQEFILFNTPLQNHTFHKEVKRLFNIDALIIENNEIKFKKHKKENEENRSLGKTFQGIIEKIIPDIKELKHGIFLSGGGESRINAAIGHYFNLNKDFITWGHSQNKEYVIASRIAEKQKTPHLNIRPAVYNLPYRNLLYKTGFLSNMQYSYRYDVLKEIVKKHKYDIIWTGWGDINGYPTMYQPSELFTDFYLGLYKGAKLYPKGWNHEWLKSYKLNNNKLYNHIIKSPTTETFSIIKKEELAPRIFGQVLSTENLIMPVFAPWFSPEMYTAVEREENFNPKLITDKKSRVLWKGEVYYQLIRKYAPELNKIIHSKGYYPWMVRKETGLIGLALATTMKHLMNKMKYPFDPVDDKIFLVIELKKILDSSNSFFDKSVIEKIIKESTYWNGSDILEIFKIVQIFWIFYYEDNYKDEITNRM